MLLITGPQRARSKINWARVVLEPAIVLAGAPEQETAPAAAGRERAQAAVELELGPVEAEPELVRVAVTLRTKSATEAHRQDLVRLLAAGASAVAVVETSLAPAAAEAVTVWVAVDSAPVADAAVEDVGDKGNH